MDGSPEQFAIRVSDLVVGFRQQAVIDHLSMDVRRVRFLAWSAHPVAANPC
jgi:phospholipid/cholesterol/gamma-HCH transport system ATP-binding protein